MFDNLFNSIGVSGTLGVVGGGVAMVLGAFMIQVALVSLARTPMRRLASKRA